MIKRNIRSMPKRHLVGFTIVELLVVIVVIGILATISIVSYTGISNKAIIASIQSDLNNASKQLKMYQVENSAFPTSIDCTPPFDANSICLKSSNGNALTLSTIINSLPQRFCIDLNKNTTNYRVTYKGAPEPGLCSELTTTVNFTSVGASTWSTDTLPAGITSVIFEVWGAQGGKGGNSCEGNLGGTGGYGGYVKGTKNITAGQTYTINIGAVGAVGGNCVGYGDGTTGGVGQETNIKLGATYYARGYGGTGGTGGTFDCSGPGCDGNPGSTGSTWSDASLTGVTTTPTVNQSGNGKVSITYSSL